MSNEWAADVIRDMFLLKLTNRRLAVLTGYSAEYISMLLHGKKQSEIAKEKILNAIKAEQDQMVDN